MVREVTDVSFESDVLERSDSAPVVVEFWAPWCAPCAQLEPLLNSALEDAGPDIAFVRINADENPRTCSSFGVQSIPFVVAIHERQVVQTLLGLQGAETVRQFVASLPAALVPSLPMRSAGTPQAAFLSANTAELLRAEKAVLAAITNGREALVAACEKRNRAELAFEETAKNQAEDYAARIACLTEYAENLKVRIGYAGSFNGVDRARDEARRNPWPDCPDVDALVTRQGGRVQAQVSPAVTPLADASLEVARSVAQKISGTMTKAIHRSAYVDAIRGAYSIGLSAFTKAEDLAREQVAAAAALNRQREEAKAVNDAAVQAAAYELEQSVNTRCEEYDRLLVLSPVVARPGWRAAEWQDWSPSSEVQPIHLGLLEAPLERSQREHADLPTNVVPLTDDLRRIGGLLYSYKDATRPAALSAARSLIARVLASIPPGKARFTFFDPLGLGEAVAPFLALADHDQKLIDGKVWSNVDGLRSRLTEHMNHIEIVIQKYLRGDYETIEDYNRHAGEIAEPYRFLFVYDYPSQFDEGTAHQLARIIENGPRCGVYTILLANADTRPPHGASIQTLPHLPKLIDKGPFLAFGQQSMVLAYDIDPIQSLGTVPGQSIIDRIVDLVGRSARGMDNVTVDLPKALRLHAEIIRAGVRSDLPARSSPATVDDPASWWANTSSEAIAAPIGQSGARDVALLRFDSETLSGGLLVGRPGSGKSTLLHSYIGGLCALYPPWELELYLIDFKEGVEFKVYAETGLPHARCVAVESERDFGLSVLESIVDEMKRRAELIRSTGGEQTSFGRLRASLGHPLPRIVLVFDEFHVLFVEDDKIGATAAGHLETIIRQGRGFGVHVLLGSQSLAGLDALGRHVLQLLPIRLLLPSSESDAQLVLGDGNSEWRSLSRRGEGILNTSAGAVEANIPFQAAFESEEDRLGRLRQLRHKADAAEFTRRPVVFEGYGASDITAEAPTNFVDGFARRSLLTVPLRIGTPMSLAGPIELELRREGGSNVLIIGRASHGVPLGVTLTGLAAAVSSSARPHIEFVDFTAVDEGVDEALQPFTDAGLISLTRRRAAGRVVAELGAEVARRIDEDDVRAPALLLVLFGIHRARDLDPDRSSDPFEIAADNELESSLRRILVNGPEVGIHVLAWADSVASLGRRLPPALRREFGMVVAGPMSRDDSMELIDSDAASTLKSHQIVVYNDDAGTIQRGRSFGAPSAEWLLAVSSQVQRFSINQ